MTAYDMRISDWSSDVCSSDLLLEADMALGHLAPDRIGMLLAPLDLGFDAVRFEVRLDAPPDPLDEVAAALVKLLEPLGDRFIGVGLELAEGEGLHPGHELVPAAPLGQRDRKRGV